MTPASDERSSRGVRAWVRDHGPFVRYVGVGLFNTALDLTLFTVFAVGVGLWEIWANVCSTTITLCVSYFLNRRFVFRSDAGYAQSFVQFVAVTLFSGLLVQSGVIWVVVHLAAPLPLCDSTVAVGAKVCAMGVGLVTNYLGYRWLFGRTARRD